MLSIPMEPQEVMGPKEANKNDTHMTSAAAFVEGGIQDACDDACSICLENFSDSDPSTVTNCKHEFHLQCILEWCQRSSQCPMCWQPISLKDPTSQELFEAVEQERNFRSNGSRNTTLFHHPMLGEFEIQHLPSGSTEADLEERILQHLAAAAAMRRAHHHVSRREGHRGRPSLQGHPRFLAFSGPRGVVSSSSAHVDHEREQSSGPRGSTSVSFTNSSDDPELLVSTHPAEATFHASGSANRSSACRTTSENQDREGASELQSFSESLRARLNSLSMRYKESFSRSTRGWKERLFARNNSMADIGSEVRREVNAGIANVSRLMEQSRDQNRAASHDSLSNSAVEPLNIQQQGNQTTMERSGEGRRTSVSHGAASSISD